MNHIGMIAKIETHRQLAQRAIFKLQFFALMMQTGRDDMAQKAITEALEYLGAIAEKEDTK